MGKTSLRDLLTDKREIVCSFTLSKGEESEVTSTQPVIAEVQASPVVVEEVKVVEEQSAPIVEEVPVSLVLKDVPAPASNPVVEEFKAEEVPAAEPKKIKAMHRNTKNEAVFRMLCNGATVKEICDQLKWTEGAVSSVVYWEPNNKGYGLEREKVEGRGTILFLTIDNKRITEEDLVFSN